MIDLFNQKSAHTLTVGGVLRQGNQRKFKVMKPLAEVTRRHLASAIRGST